MGVPTLISFIAAVSCCSLLSSLLPKTVTRINLLSTSVRSYVSNASVVPLLVPLRTSVKVVPSSEVDITKLYDLSSPLSQATPILQTGSTEPKSACMKVPNPSSSHFVS